MTRKAASQWEFGELFSPAETRKTFTVSELTSSVRKLLEERVGSVWVDGEVTNLRIQASGHAYFSLKDPEAQLGCVLFRGIKVTGRELLDNGVKVIAQGDLTVYEPRGQYQLVVRDLEFKGAGALQLAFEKLKRELDAQGWFAPERKRPLPRYPERIGLVTSSSGAALRDVVHVLQRRHPGLEIILAPCRVQGEGAAAEIAAGIEDLNRWSGLQPQGRGLDAIVVTRGGGSLEDLWAFNELPVAEAIYRSTLPVVSAIGHEIDFTISDFVADLRAATPSAAAEILSEQAFRSRQLLVDLLRSMAGSMRRGTMYAAETLREVGRRFRRCEPTRHLHERMQWVDELNGNLSRRAAATFRRLRLEATSPIKRLQLWDPSSRITSARADLKSVILSLRRELARRFDEKLQHAIRIDDKLQLLSPIRTIDRGYTVTNTVSGIILRRIASVTRGDRIETRLADGTIISEVLETRPNPPETTANPSQE
jgi:exodeoxyribonuclease VII large subunit